MTILEAIRQADLHYPNSFSQQQKLRWLSYLDGLIHQELHCLYEGNELPFGGYDECTDLSSSLLVQEPYAQELYLRYLERQMDDANGDSERCMNSLQLFQAAYKTYARWYNRTHKAKTKGRKYQ